MGIQHEGARPYPPQSTTHLTGASSTSSAIAISPGYYVFKCKATTDSTNTGVCLIFGDSSVANATTSNGWLIAPGESITWYVPPLLITHFKHIRNGTGDAAFQYAKSGD